ncbi:DUF6067 family protein [Parabacteroides sp. OttesenSCG-928-G06]|nr:DUF6067 family protein [Parabacteroides sp. OttesenSCG-928-K15]MDL2281979.1 DUF6067 family protein [Parabacteroides sp. OttesenSCG-928-G06]
MKKTLFILSLLLLCSMAKAQDFRPDASFYGIGFWTPDTLGNHRAIVKVDKAADAVKATIPWRRHDADIEKKEIIIIDATTGDQILNFTRLSLSPEKGELAFQPRTTPGEYYVYYMPYQTSRGPYPKINYTKSPSRADENWLKQVENNKQNLPQAQFKEFQSLSEFDKFYPMEIAATENEKQQLLDKNKGKNFLLFAENRENPIKMYHTIPYRWAVKEAGSPFSAEADQNEYFVYQVGVWATEKDLKNIRVTFSDLTNENGVIPASSMTCFNTEGTDWLQRKMDITCDVDKGRIQPLWMGVQMPVGLRMGVYTGKVTITAENERPQTIDIRIKLSDYILQDKGDSDIHRLARLRWLNSSFADNDEIVQPFTPLKINGQEITCLGRNVTINNYGFPEKINSFFTEEVTTIGKEAVPVLASPLKFVIEQNRKEVNWTNESFEIDNPAPGAAYWTSRNKAGDFNVTTSGKMEFDGFMEYKVTVKATCDAAVSDIRVEIPINGDISKYWLGMGKQGSFVPNKYDWKWDLKNAQEGYWIGDVNAGLHTVFRAEDYVRPLNTNFYELKPLILPECWYNSGKGGITLRKSGKTMMAKTYSGDRTLKAGEELTFIFLVSVTPFKPIDTEKQWTDRYYHAYRPIDDILAQGANIVNIHHANAINPFINYPFFRPDYMKAYIDEAHEKGVKVKIYYTVRELANRAPELWALRSLGHEVFASGAGGGYSWLQEHLGGDYIGAWFVDRYKDAAIVNSGVSRWHNYYVEGLHWLIKNVGIDGLYIDDLAIDRTTMKRIRRILEQYREEPRIDLHSANQYNKRDGFINSACLYMEHMPYLDRLWLGEYFDYSSKPDFWMTEVAGIPFGMMGEMLQDGGNPWRGMVYGMTSRQHYGRKNAEIPARLWKVWDNFGIKGSRMMGYWVSYNPIKTNNKEVLATSFIKDNKVMVAVASWAAKEVDVKLLIDWQKLGIDPANATMYAPAIEEFQPEMRLKPGDSFRIPKEQGFIFIIE